MIRITLINQINRLISTTSFFTINEFTITNFTRESTEYLEIQYQSQPNYKFTVIIPDRKTKSDEYPSLDYRFIGKVSPGEVASPEHISFYGITELTSNIDKWLGRVQEEIKNTPIYRHIIELREEIEQSIEGLEEKLEDGYFSQEEAENIKQKLDELEKKLIENIKKTVKEQKHQNEKITLLEKDIVILKSRLENSTKRNWIVAAAMRMTNWTAKPTNESVVMAAIQTTTQLISESIKYLPPGK